MTLVEGLFVERDLRNRWIWFRSTRWSGGVYSIGSPLAGSRISLYGEGFRSLITGQRTNTQGMKS